MRILLKILKVIKIILKVLEKFRNFNHISKTINDNCNVNYYSLYCTEQ